MKKLMLVVVFLSIMAFSGCNTSGSSVIGHPVAVNSWWGTKQEIVTFLDSPGAQAERWFIVSLEGTPNDGR